jgi:hypothetical protein
MRQVIQKMEAIMVQSSSVRHVIGNLVHPGRLLETGQVIELKYKEAICSISSVSCRWFLRVTDQARIIPAEAFHIGNAHRTGPETRDCFEQVHLPDSRPRLERVFQRFLAS